MRMPTKQRLKMDMETGLEVFHNTRPSDHRLAHQLASIALRDERACSATLFRGKACDPGGLQMGDAPARAGRRYGRHAGGGLGGEGFQRTA